MYRLLDGGFLWPSLTAKRLAIVSGHADSFAARLMNPEFVWGTGGGEITWTIETEITCPTVHEPKRSQLPRIRDQQLSTQWDLLLSSAGALSAVLCEQARILGRKALDVGWIDLTIANNKPIN